MCSTKFYSMLKNVFKQYLKIYYYYRIQKVLLKTWMDEIYVNWKHCHGISRKFLSAVLLAFDSSRYNDTFYFYVHLEYSHKTVEKKKQSLELTFKMHSNKIFKIFGIPEDYSKFTQLSKLMHFSHFSFKLKILH